MASGAGSSLKSAATGSVESADRVSREDASSHHSHPASPKAPQLPPLADPATPPPHLPYRSPRFRSFPSLDSWGWKGWDWPRTQHRLTFASTMPNGRVPMMSESGDSESEPNRPPTHTHFASATDAVDELTHRVRDSLALSCPSGEKPVASNCYVAASRQHLVITRWHPSLTPSLPVPLRSSRLRLVPRGWQWAPRNVPPSSSHSPFPTPPLSSLILASSCPGPLSSRSLVSPLSRRPALSPRARSKTAFLRPNPSPYSVSIAKAAGRCPTDFFVPFLWDVFACC